MAALVTHTHTHTHTQAGTRVCACTFTHMCAQRDTCTPFFVRAHMYKHTHPFACAHARMHAAIFVLCLWTGSYHAGYPSHACALLPLHCRWLDIIAARKIILQIVERFSGPGQALTRAANQTQYISPWAAAVGQPQPQPLQQQQPGQQQWRHGVLPDTLGAAHPGYGSGSVGELTQQPFAAEAQHYCSKKCCSNEDQSHHVRGSSLGADTGAALAASTAAPAATEVQVDMRAFVEAPPIMPHSCSPRTMAQQRECGKKELGAYLSNVFADSGCLQDDGAAA